MNNNNMSKFKNNDIVQTNLAFVEGFDDYSPPPNMTRKRNLKVVGMVDTPKTEMAKGGILYSLISKSGKECQILECFLEMADVVVNVAGARVNMSKMRNVFLGG